MSKSPPPILVTGATGTVGREVVGQLLAAGRPVRALTRYPDRARLDARVEVVRGDLERPDTLAEAVKGVDRIFSLAVGPQLGEQEAALAQAARGAGVRHIVKLSVLGAGDNARGGVVSWHNAGERALRQSGVSWTFVQPGAFMSNALFWADSIRREGRVYSNFGDGRTAPVHPRDIAAVAVLALTTPGQEGKSWPLTGPESLSTGRQVRLLATALGRPLEYVPISDDQARERLEQAGMPAYLIEALVPFAAVVRSGKAGSVLPTVEQLTGRPALTFAEWARENAAAFR
ncbi:MAG TPA: SDR family oxidoreductase [Planctomycetota bacterium]|nr:SDR family oxidoreductase [Planctomycetota bacterium]